jgi:ribosomal protein S18 acetylase RimI-like enzyme
VSEGFVDGTLVRAVGPSDLAWVARVHRAAFVRGALTQLGEEAVRRYYLWQLEGPHDHFFRAAWRDGEPLGFCVSGISRGAVSGFLARNRTFLVLQVLRRPWLVSNALIRDRICVALRLLGGRHRPPEGTNATRPPMWGILSIALAPNAQGSGAASLLMDDAESEARRRGVDRMHLTVATDNARAIRFYEKLGWFKVPPGDGWGGRMEKVVAPVVPAQCRSEEA